MLNQILNGILSNPWVLAIGTVAFFTVKGILWLLIPFLIVRWRRLTIQSKRVDEVAATGISEGESVVAYDPPAKRAA